MLNNHEKYLEFKILLKLSRKNQNFLLNNYMKYQILIKNDYR